MTIGSIQFIVDRIRGLEYRLNVLMDHFGVSAKNTEIQINKYVEEDKKKIERERTEIRMKCPHKNTSSWTLDTDPVRYYNKCKDCNLEFEK